MGYEYGFVFTTLLSLPQLEELTHHLQLAPRWFLVQVEQQASGYRLSYAYAASGPIAWDEDFLLLVSEREIYVLLHTATASQEAGVLTWVQECAATLGLAGILSDI
jgi:hypothetical protein